jgi:cytochrome c oxidase cbb3-type subunit I/II
MYYFVPKAVGRPIYSYRLSIVHFWSLIFIYIWAGPHHLLNTSTPDWAQTLGMVFSLMLWAPSWGGMINGLLTLRGVWHRLRTEPVLKFYVAALTFYGMSTFEGPMLSIKSVNGLVHYTDWIIAHVHSGALGWNGFLAFGMLYFLLPKLYRTKLYSNTLAEWHFWLGTIGILLYIIAMYTSGITQGLMWQAITPDGRLVYPDFVETVLRIVPLYWVRVVGGTMYFAGWAIMCYNMYKTVAGADPVLAAKVDTYQAPRLLPVSASALGSTFHRRLEAMIPTFGVLAFVAIIVGSIIELLPTVLLHTYQDSPFKVEPYTALELAGRDVYQKEGCYNCHSQMIRTQPFEVLRYGAASRSEESMYDHPFQWGSKRTGPDLARVGGKYPSLWHYRHMLDPRSTTPNSLMPPYGWLFEKKTDFSGLEKRMATMKMLGVPYTDEQVRSAKDDAMKQALVIKEELGADVHVADVERKQIVALIAYLQRLGKNPAVLEDAKKLSQAEAEKSSTTVGRSE